VFAISLSLSLSFSLSLSVSLSLLLFLLPFPLSLIRLACSPALAILMHACTEPFDLISFPSRGPLSRTRYTKRAIARQIMIVAVARRPRLIPSSFDDDYGARGEASSWTGADSFPELPGSAQLARRHGVPPRRMMIVAMMTPRAMFALRRAAIVDVRHVLAAFHLMRDRVTERPWTAFPVAPDLAVLKKKNRGSGPITDHHLRIRPRNPRGISARKRIIPEQNGSGIRFASFLFSPFFYDVT